MYFGNVTMGHVPEWITEVQWTIGQWPNRQCINARSTVQCTSVHVRINALEPAGAARASQPEPELMHPGEQRIWDVMAKIGHNGENRREWKRH